MGATAQTGSAAWTDGEKIITESEVVEGLHFIFDTAVEGYWVTSQGVVRDEVSE